MVLDRRNTLGRVPIVMNGSNSFWLDPKSFWIGPNDKNNPEKSNLNLTKRIWALPKEFGPNQNNLYPSKIIWMVQNHFGPIEGQGINPKNIILKLQKHVPSEGF